MELIPKGVFKQIAIVYLKPEKSERYAVANLATYVCKINMLQMHGSCQSVSYVDPISWTRPRRGSGWNMSVGGDFDIFPNLRHNHCFDASVECIPGATYSQVRVQTRVVV